MWSHLPGAYWDASASGVTWKGTRIHGARASSWDILMFVSREIFGAVRC